MNNEKWIFFDVMGVVFIVGDDIKDLLTPFIKEHNHKIQNEKIESAYMDASFGKITSYEFWRLMGFDYQQIYSLEKQYLDTKLTIDAELISVLEELYKNYKIGLLSNDLSEWSKHLRKKYDLDRFFDCIVISGNVKCRKPSSQIYEIALEKANCQAKNCIFIDDRIKNLYPAQKLGINVIKFNRENISHLELNIPQIDNLQEIPEIIKTIF